MNVVSTGVHIFLRNCRPSDATDLADVSSFHTPIQVLRMWVGVGESIERHSCHICLWLAAFDRFRRTCSNPPKT